MFRLDMPLLRSGGPHPTTTPIVAYDLISYCEAFYFGKEFLRMAGIVKMLHAQQPPNDKYLLMPTEREHSQHNPEIKRDHRPAWRPRFLDHAVPDVGSSLIIKTIVGALALYGLYHLIF